MRQRLTAFGLLLAVMIALAAAVWLTGQPTRRDESRRVSRLPASVIKRIRVQHAGRALLFVRQANNHWKMKKPVDAAADPAHIAALLKLADAHARQKYTRNAIDDKTTQLAEPRLRVRFNDGPPILVGGAGPLAGSRYVRTHSALLLILAPRLASLGVAWPHWIDPALLPAGARLKRVQLPRFTLERGPAGHWRLAAPVPRRSRRAAQATVQAWQGVKALSVETADAKRTPTAYIEFDFANTPPLRLGIIQRAPDLVLRNKRLGVDYRLAHNRLAPLLRLEHPHAFTQ